MTRPTIPLNNYNRKPANRFMEKYIFREYNPEYKKFFRAERARLKKLLGKSVKIEHVGSTAIPNLGGKGIIDILIGVPKNKIEKIRKKLEKADYLFSKKASTPDRLFLKKDYPYKQAKRRVHIHLTVLNSEEWKEIIMFRNYLKKHPELIEKYAKIKKAAVKKARGKGEIYRKQKEKFIKSVLKKARE